METKFIYNLSRGKTREEMKDELFFTDFAKVSHFLSVVSLVKSAVN